MSMMGVLVSLFGLLIILCIGGLIAIPLYFLCGLTGWGLLMTSIALGWFGIIVLAVCDI